MAKFKVEMIKLTLKNLMLITIFYQLLLVIGDPIFLGGFKMGDEVLYQSGLGDVFSGHGAGGDLVLDDSHEC